MVDLVPQEYSDLAPFGEMSLTNGHKSIILYVIEFYSKKAVKRRVDIRCWQRELRWVRGSADTILKMALELCTDNIL